MSKELKKPSEGEEEEEWPGNGDTRRVTLSGGELNPPEIQKVVVEHILKKDDFGSHSMSPLTLSLGNVPNPVMMQTMKRGAHTLICCLLILACLLYMLTGEFLRACCLLQL